MKTIEQIHAEIDATTEFIKKIEHNLEQKSPKHDLERIKELTISVKKD